MFIIMYNAKYQTILDSLSSDSTITSCHTHIEMIHSFAAQQIKQHRVHEICSDFWFLRINLFQDKQTTIIAH